ncbi:hypothetical protein ACEQ8H_001395 [Pleosporales sp. CAS-2024a]
MELPYGIKHTIIPNGDQNIAYFRDSQSTFRNIRVVVHTTGRRPNGMSDNHVSLLLLLEKGSVRLNMRTVKTEETEEAAISGDLVWSWETYQTPNSEIIHFDITLGSAIEVSTLYSYIWNDLSYQYSREVDSESIEIKTGTFLTAKEWEEDWKLSPFG